MRIGVSQQAGRPMAGLRYDQQAFLLSCPMVYQQHRQNPLREGPRRDLSYGVSSYGFHHRESYEPGRLPSFLDISNLDRPAPGRLYPSRLGCDETAVLASIIMLPLADQNCCQRHSNLRQTQDIPQPWRANPTQNRVSPVGAGQHSHLHPSHHHSAQPTERHQACSALIKSHPELQDKLDILEDRGKKLDRRCNADPTSSNPVVRMMLRKAEYIRQKIEAEEQDRRQKYRDAWYVKQERELTEEELQIAVCPVYTSELKQIEELIQEAESTWIEHGNDKIPETSRIAKWIEQCDYEIPKSSKVIDPNESNEQQGFLISLHEHCELAHLLVATYLGSEEMPWEIIECIKLVAEHANGYLEADDVRMEHFLENGIGPYVFPSRGPTWTRHQLLASLIHGYLGARVYGKAENNKLILRACEIILEGQGGYVSGKTRKANEEELRAGMFNQDLGILLNMDLDEESPDLEGRVVKALENAVGVWKKARKGKSVTREEQEAIKNAERKASVANCEESDPVQDVGSQGGSSSEGKGKGKEVEESKEV